MSLPSRLASRVGRRADCDLSATWTRRTRGEMTRAPRMAPTPAELQPDGRTPDHKLDLRPESRRNITEKFFTLESTKLLFACPPMPTGQDVLIPSGWRRRCQASCAPVIIRRVRRVGSRWLSLWVFPLAGFQLKLVPHVFLDLRSGNCSRQLLERASPRRTWTASSRRCCRCRTVRGRGLFACRGCSASRSQRPCDC